jgi:predicted GNAT superfamily acetyltransferase
MGSCHHLTLVHRKIWVGEGEGIEPVPTHVLITLAKNGGLVLGAYAEDGPPETNGMVGFIVGWLATPPYPPEPGQTPHLKHCSHIAGVLPDFQGRGAGVLLKLAQREEVLAQRITNHVTWTYDPLYRVNGALNIHRLGAVCTTYLRDVYGQMDDALNAGAPTDRLGVARGVTCPGPIPSRNGPQRQTQDDPHPGADRVAFAAPAAPLRRHGDVGGLRGAAEV